MTSLTLVFDSSKTLVLLSMTLPKDPQWMLTKLSGKYKVVENRIDNFMNNGTARLSKGYSVVIIEAPHLSFAMDVTYTATDFLAFVLKADKEAKAAKQKEQSSKF